MAKEYPEELKLYDHVPNSGIVHMPGRRFPAVALQGDTISTILSAACFFIEKSKEHNDEDMYYEAVELANKMKSHLVRYEKVLTHEGFKKPYVMELADIEFPDEFESS